MIGQNIRRARQEAGYTLQQATAMLVDYGIDLASCTLSALERGERRLAADTLIALASIYGCTIESFYGQQRGAVLDLTDHELQIINFIRHEWDGDHHPLIELMGLYASCPRAIRARIASSTLTIYNEAISSGEQTTSPYKISTDYLAKKTEELL